jgi:hypothetical protein
MNTLFESLLLNVCCFRFHKQDGFSSLHVVSWSGHKEIVEILFSHPDININIQDEVSQ